MYWPTVVLFSVVVCIISYWIRWRRNRMNLFRKYGILGPKPNFITGNMNEFHEKRDKCIDEWLEKYGKTFGFFLGAKPYIICIDVEFIKLLQVKEFKNFSNRDLVLPDAGIPHKLIFQALDFQTDEKWKNMRSILSTSFSTGKIKMMSTLMSKPINIFLKNIEKEKEPFDITIFFKKLTFDIICRSAFGITTNVQNNETTKFVKSVYSIFEVDSSDFLSIASICFPEFEPIPTYMRHIVDAIRNMINLPSIRVVLKTCRQIIDSRKKSEYHPPDLLQTMLDAEGDSAEEEEKLTTDAVIANAMMFMIAGYDTTSNTLGWCSYYLACNPELQEKLRQEINDNIKESEEIQYNDLNNLQYMDQVISETFRISPISIISTSRICAEDFKYKDFTIPKGVIVIVPTSILHTDSNYWEEPEKFDPDRFSLENRGKIDPVIFQPFGAGPRICIGMRLANTVMKLALANLIRSFRLELHGSKELELDYSLFIIRPKNGIMIKSIPITY